MCACVCVFDCLCVVPAVQTYGTVVEFEMFRNVCIRDDVFFLISHTECSLEIESVTRYKSHQRRDCKNNFHLEGIIVFFFLFFV